MLSIRITKHFYINVNLISTTMADEKITLPGSGGGLIRYFDEYKSKIEFGPWVVVGAIIVVIMFEFVLYSFY